MLLLSNTKFLTDDKIVWSLLAMWAQHKQGSVWLLTEKFLDNGHQNDTCNQCSHINRQCLCMQCTWSWVCKHTLTHIHAHTLTMEVGSSNNFTGFFLWNTTRKNNSNNVTDVSYTFTTCHFNDCMNLLYITASGFFSKYWQMWTDKNSKVIVERR